MFLAKEKALYQTLNMMRPQSSSYVGFYWAPLELQEMITYNLSQANQTATKVVRLESHNIVPPTYFKHSDMMMVFQLITDTYGIPSYKEANPSIFSVVSFPFLFGMMFGDMGHGSIVGLFGLYLVMMNNKLQDSGLKVFLPLRYIILLMGINATYCGFIYNEFFALPTNLFTSCYDTTKTEYKYADPAIVNSDKWYFARKDPQCVYPFGLDSVWKLSTEILTMTNSQKMKLSVIIGIFHMTLGIIVKGSNAMYFRKWHVLVFEVLFGICILLFLFGWMDFLVFAKWFTDIDISDHNGAYQNTTTMQWVYPSDVQSEMVPGVIATMIVSVFNFGTPDDKFPTGSYDIFVPQNATSTIQENQTRGQKMMFTLAGWLMGSVLILVPCMLFVIPCCFRGPSVIVHEDNEIEFSNIESQNEPLMASIN